VAYPPIITMTIRKFDAPRLVAVLADLIEDKSFTSADLVELALHNTELRDAIGDMTARKLGKALRSIAGRDVGGYTLRNDGRDMDGVIWRVYPV
jgi:hypothetical protein